MSAKCSRFLRIIAASSGRAVPQPRNVPSRRHGPASFALAGCLAGLLTACAEAPGGDAPGAPDSVERRPLLVLSEHVGDVGLEAIKNGLPKVTDRAQVDASPDGILYVDVDSVAEADLRGVFDLVHAGLQSGRSAVIETSEFDFDKMHGIVASEFPEIDRSTIEDVAVLLHREASTGAVTAMRIDPSELAVRGGVDLADTMAGRARTLAQKMAQSVLPANAPGPKLADTAALGSGYYDPINFAIRAYDASPGTQGVWQLRHNGTYVDVWKTGSGSNTGCYVAWRGTDTSNFWDVWADGSSQFAQAIRVDNAEGNTTLKGGRGFVNRLHAYDNTVKDVAGLRLRHDHRA